MDISLRENQNQQESSELNSEESDLDANSRENQHQQESSEQEKEKDVQDTDTSQYALDSDSETGMCNSNSHELEKQPMAQINQKTSIYRRKLVKPKQFQEFYLGNEK